MGKPVRGPGQFPFNINGLVASGAKIGNISHVNSLFIYKQRSYNMYDLIDEYKNVYKYCTLVSTDEKGKELDFLKPDFDLVPTLKERTFYIKAQNTDRSKKGFVTLYQYNKLKLHNGEYIFRKPEFDPALSAVFNYPSKLTMEVGDTRPIIAEYVPVDYTQKDGIWYTSDDSVIKVVADKVENQNEAYIVGLKEGTAILTFVPNANKTKVSITEITVTSAPLTLKGLTICQDGNNGINGFGKHPIGKEFNFYVIPDPYNFVPDEDYTFEFNTPRNVLFLGTTDPTKKIYTAKALQYATYSRVTVFYKKGTPEEQSASANYTFYMERDLTGQPLEVSILSDQFGINNIAINTEYNLTAIFNPEFNYDPSVKGRWEVLNTDEITEPHATINQDGVLVATSVGSIKVKFYYKSFVYETNSTIIDNRPRSIHFEPILYKNFAIGEQFKLTAVPVPANFDFKKYGYIWQSTNPDVCTVDSEGNVTVLSYGRAEVSYRLPGLPDYDDPGLQGNTGRFAVTGGIFQDIENLYMFNDAFLRSYKVGSVIYIGQMANTAPQYVKTYNVTYTSSDPTVISIEQDPFFAVYNRTRLHFKLTMLKPGSSTITIRSIDNPDIVDTITLIVY